MELQKKIKTFYRQTIENYSLNRLLGDDKNDFFQKINFRNYSIVKKLLFILLVLHVPLLIIDYVNYRSNLWDSTRGYQYLFFCHFIMAVILTCFFLFLLINRVRPKHPVLPRYNSVTNFLILLVLIWSACVSSVDQLIHGQITAYILAIFVAATACYCSNIASLVTFAIPTGVLFTGITLLQKNHDILQGHYINGTILIVMGWILSRILFYGKVREYKSLKIIEAQNKMLEKMSIEDSLTGLHNRRYLSETLDKSLAVAQRYGQVLTIAMADIDHFKKINDKFSHKVGDEVLKAIAGIFKQSIRKTDDVARYGGEEFVFAIDRSSLQNAAGVCEKIRRLVESYDWDRIQPGLGVTISFGLAESKGSGNYEQLLAEADKKLYEAKKAGRNRVKF